MQPRGRFSLAAGCGGRIHHPFPDWRPAWDAQCQFRLQCSGSGRVALVDPRAENRRQQAQPRRMKTPTLSEVSDWSKRNRWIWSLLGVLILWALLSAVTNQLSFSSLSGVAISSSFLVLAALG